MKVLYIGQYNKGSTSRMRGETIEAILGPKKFDVVDTRILMDQSSRFWRSMSFRYNLGLLVQRINAAIMSHCKNETYHLIWVDKGTYIKPATTRFLSTITEKLVHFTPDMAFYSNKSRLFLKSLSFYDFVVTTKFHEQKLYLKYIGPDKLLLVSQGYSKKSHQQVFSYLNKKNEVAFIGLGEAHRYNVVQKLIDHGVSVKLAGYKWEEFLKKNQNNKSIDFVDKELLGENYTKVIGSAKIALGLLSKKFPELHTTRTFEIPAIGTALLTERNPEIESFYSEDEVIFYNDLDEMVEKVKYYLGNDKELEALSKKGQDRAVSSGYDYESILKDILSKVLS